MESSTYILKEVKPPSKTPIYIAIGIAVLVCLIGLILVIVGGVKLSRARSCGKERSTVKPRKAMGDRCKYSYEARRIGLKSFLERVKTTYYKMNPNKAVHDPDSTPTTVRQDFSPYNAHPEAIRRRTDAARALHREAKAIAENAKPDRLKPRERKAISQVKHFLQSNFGAPYDENYYAGDWMLGPNKFCWQPICYVGSDLNAHFTYKPWGIKPKSTADVDFVIDHFKKLNESLVQYVENVKYGVRAGFVRSVEDCQDGLYSIQRMYLNVSQQGPIGILNESYTMGMRDAQWLSELKQDAAKAWETQHGETVRDSVNKALVEYVGKPLDGLLRFLEFNHSLYCVPSNVSSGLATLPLRYIYKNGTNTWISTTRVLPSGEPLDGKKAYEMILPYFTTNDMHPNQVYVLGETMLKKLYPRAVESAKKLTGNDSEEGAVEEFKKRLQDQSMFFNDEKIPENESNKDAFAKCTSMESAKVYCPKRYQGMLTWFDFVNTVMSDLAPKTNHMFHFTGRKQSAPNCPVQLVANFNPGTGSQSYVPSDKNCTKPARYRLPFYLRDLGPRYNAISVGAHEARPGHHTQVSVRAENIGPHHEPIRTRLIDAKVKAQGFTELFGDTCGGVIGWLNDASYYTAFTEGWALYAENPLVADETDTYKNDPLQLYGMLKWQIWRALRLMMDTGLHYRGMKRWQALELFAKYAWDKTDKAVKDVTRYQSDPGQATAYMIGQLKIWTVRNKTQAAIEKNKGVFSEKDFHYQVLSQGSSPLSYMESHMKTYAACVTNPEAEGCEYIIGMPESRNSGNAGFTNKPVKPVKPFEERPYHEHHE